VPEGQEALQLPPLALKRPAPQGSQANAAFKNSPAAQELHDETPFFPAGQRMQEAMLVAPEVLKVPGGQATQVALDIAPMVPL